MSKAVKQEDFLEDDDDPRPQEVIDNFDPEVEEYYSVTYSITSYGADYPVDGLVKRLDSGAIFIPSFQRSYVWNIFRASRFIESLLLGLPVPAVFLAKEKDSNKLLVIDGQQRLKTLQYFYKGIFQPKGIQFKLKGVHPEFNGCTYATLDENARIKLDDSLIHAIIVQQDAPDDEQQSSTYHIFERLNTGGVLLQPQEIRSCISHGAFVKLINELNDDQYWRKLFGKKSARMRDQELILRFFALYFKGKDYTKPMKEFLNRFMRKHRHLNGGITEKEFADIFRKVTKTICEHIGEAALRPDRAVNAAVSDAVMVGVANRLDDGDVTKPSQFRKRYDVLMQTEKFNNWVSATTTDETAVGGRIGLATQVFAKVP